MRFITTFSLLCLLAIPLRAQQPSNDPRAAEISAATANAVSALRDQIAPMPLAANLSVRDLLVKTQGDPILLNTLGQSEQVGDPRWVDDRTCQIRLEIAAPRVAAILVGLAAAHPKDSPIPANALSAKLATDWQGLTFAATGSSAGGANIESVQPPGLTGPWANVKEPTRRNAIAEARQHAIAKVLNAIAPVPLTNGKTLADALSNGDLRQTLTAWMAIQPVTRLEFRDNLQVSITLAIDPAQLTDVLHHVLSQRPEYQLLSDSAWSRIRSTITTQLPPAIGVASLAPPSHFTAPPPLIPAQIPDWVNRQLDAEATAAGDPGASPLKVARVAENAARSQLLLQINALPLSPASTLGNASRSDSALLQAVVRGLEHAHVYKTDYYPDGRVHVRMNLSLRELWEEIRLAQ